ncbi:hypothetical protein GCM10010168_38540 [Actinoplanes ianthinogenes]|uniref:Uncharacterized protein n=1 Tax=Actinoplanes ianthinogenes TaxID=122358 RepID=A0ABM7M4V9_9ACTN|nr:DUF6114 domain-containing protein [Actinoplanes ianthinogenes]BCJ46623.1 hypothetical protein Aiant_72800 [Actinoplanes ianthinogenes]GGR16876.1 hypothetical protein GCM10010168_38540 [Actinoplanes ianthinogenes]
MATDDFWTKFRRWRRSRPFWGGLFLLVSGLLLFLSSNLSLLTEMRLEIHVGPQGFLSYVLPLLMLMCGVLVWFTPAQRMFYGIIGLLTAVYSFLGLNFGGWIIGMLVGILGGALAVAWQPRPTQPEVPKQGPTDFGGPDNHGQGPSGDDQHHDGLGENTEAIQIAGHDDRPHDTTALRPPAQSDPSILPGFEQPRGDLPGPRRGLNRKALALIVVPAFVGATVLIGSRIPASADDCPAGLPSISTSVTPSAATSTSAKASVKKAAESASAKPNGKKTTTAAADSGKTSTSASATPSASATTENSNPILDGISDVVDGVGNLLGIGGDEESSSPSASPTPSASETTTPAAEPTGTATTTPAAGGDSTTATSAPAKTTSPAASASADSDVIPCLGARQEGLVADGGIPKSAIKPGIMKVSSLTLYNSTYEGVADVPTANGTIKALQLNMTKAVNEPFSLEIDEPGSAVTTIKSKKLTVEGNVKFYTPKMTGNLFGIIPITFTPEQPPPLTLPLLWFTNVTIELAFVSCDTLTASPITITES